MAKRHLTARIPHIYKTTPQTDWKHALSPALTHPCRCKFQPGPNVNLPQRSCGTRAIGKGYMRRPQLGLAFQRCFRVLGPYSGITTWPGLRTLASSNFNNADEAVYTHEEVRDDYRIVMAND